MNKLSKQEIPLIISRNILLILSDKKWSLRKLSEASGIPYESLKKIINQKIKNPSLYSILQISEALGCNIDYLLE